MDRRSFVWGASGALAALPLAAAPAQARPATVTFLFHNGLYTNLHHRLYREALARRSARASGMRVLSGAESLTDRDRARWFHALALYDTPEFTRDLATDPQMRRTLDALVASDDAHALEGAALPPRLREALEIASPIYRRTFWPDDLAKNHAWIVSALPSIHTFGSTVSKRLQAIWAASWPSPTVRVDVVRYANTFGSYTIPDPPHIVVASADSLNAGRAAIEVLFRQLSFTVVSPDHGPIGTAMAAEATHEHQNVPSDLCEALVFFTTGRVVAEVYHQAHDLPYQPYANVAGLFERMWQPLLEPLSVTWLPYMDGNGKAKLDRVVRKLVAESITATSMTSAPRAQ